MNYDEYIELYHMPDDNSYYKYVDNELKKIKKRYRNGRKNHYRSNK